MSWKRTDEPMFPFPPKESTCSRPLSAVPPAKTTVSRKNNAANDPLITQLTDKQLAMVGVYLQNVSQNKIVSFKLHLLQAGLASWWCAKTATAQLLKASRNTQPVGKAASHYAAIPWLSMYSSLYSHELRPMTRKS